MDSEEWDEKCSKCGESIFLTFMCALEGDRFGYGQRQCACRRYYEQEEILRV